MSYKKTRLVPCGVHNKETQTEFAKQILEIVDECKNGNNEVLFLDPTHQVYNTVNGYCWQPKGRAGTRVIFSSSGRKRINIIGAINAITHKPTTLIAEDNCDKDMIIKSLELIRKDYLSAGTIYVFLDNTRYSKNKEVYAIADKLNIKLKFLPTYPVQDFNYLTLSTKDQTQ
ncbi:MAG: transposase [Candidatus Falkowbacteria bacterium]|nr:transposase [Candidatus Falkowbacteria bacterium]